MLKLPHYWADYRVARSGMVNAMRAGCGLRASLAERADAAGAHPHSDYFNNAARLAGTRYRRALDLHVTARPSAKPTSWGTCRRTSPSSRPDRANPTRLVGRVEGNRWPDWCFWVMSEGIPFDFNRLESLVHQQPIGQFPPPAATLDAPRGTSQAYSGASQRSNEARGGPERAGWASTAGS